MFNKNFSKEPTYKQKIGQAGEDCACAYLRGLGYKILERNYLKKWGEIDIIASKGEKIYFVEVKTVSKDLSNVTHVTKNTISTGFMNIVLNMIRNINRFTNLYRIKSNPHQKTELSIWDSYRAEDNMHTWKLERLGRAVQSYLLDRDISDKTEWQFDLITVQIDMNKGLHIVEVLEDIVL